MTETEKGTARVTAQLRSDFVFRPARGEAREFWLLLHGYEQSGAFMMSKLADCFPDDVALLAANGPFPVPRRKPDGAYRVGFAWYFWDPRSDQYYVDMEAALALLGQLVADKNPAGLPLGIVGYSQGGYLGPFAAERLPGVRRLVGMAADFLIDEVQPAPDLRLDWILGLQDEVVDAAGVRAHLAGLRARGFTVDEHLLPDEGHLISDEMKKALRKLAAWPVAKTSDPG